MWHVQFNVFCLFKTILQSQFPALCICLYLLDKQESNSFICTQECFPFTPGWWKGAISKVVNFWISLFYIRFNPVSLSMSNVLLSSTMHESRQTKMLRFLHTHRQSQSRQRSLELIKFLSQMCCKRRKYYCYVKSAWRELPCSGDGGTTETDKLKLALLQLVLYLFCIQIESSSPCT